MVMPGCSLVSALSTWKGGGGQVGGCLDHGDAKIDSSVCYTV